MFTASVALVAALAWNEAVQSVFQTFHYFEDKRIIAGFIYDIMITIIAVIISTIPLLGVSVIYKFPLGESLCLASFLCYT
ncbi:DUF5654 family protein [Natronincola peptidivorans]|uniref:DUF5654 family protein n=1 Tax=Natronincola peptidivorans TaxID=426128 RepID=UPI0038CDAE9D